MLLVLGSCAFVLFFLSDCNDWLWSCKFLRFCFPAGVVLLASVTLLQSLRGSPPFAGGGRVLLALAGMGFLLLLVYTLFFALPARASYTHPGAHRRTCTGGVYALCRHPGVLWFMGLYFCLWGAAGLPFFAAVLYSLLNIFLVFFEDRYVFPARLAGYRDYQKQTPFLLPTLQSIRACCRTD